MKIQIGTNTNIIRKAILFVVVYQYMYQIYSTYQQAYLKGPLALGNSL